MMQWRRREREREMNRSGRVDISCSTRPAKWIKKEMDRGVAWDVYLPCQITVNIKRGAEREENKWRHTCHSLENRISESWCSLHRIVENPPALHPLSHISLFTPPLSVRCQKQTRRQLPLHDRIGGARACASEKGQKRVQKAVWRGKEMANQRCSLYATELLPKWRHSLHLLFFPWRVPHATCYWLPSTDFSSPTPFHQFAFHPSNHSVMTMSRAQR